MAVVIGREIQQYDVFFSYHRADGELARRLVEALVERERLSVCLDEGEIQQVEDISFRVTGALAQSKALVALYSSTYPTRRACQFELTAAYIAAMQVEGGPGERILIVNPEQRVDHIAPADLRQRLFSSVRSGDDAQTVDEAGARLAQHVRALRGVLGDVRPLDPPEYFGRGLTGSPRFVGRVTPMWELHSILTRDEGRAIGASGPNVAQIRGLRARASRCSRRSTRCASRRPTQEESFGCRCLCPTM